MNPKHAIAKVSLDVHAPRSADGFALQNEISHWFWDKISTELEYILNNCAAPDEVIHIEQLNLNISAVSLANWQRELAPSVLKGFEDELRRILFFSHPDDKPVVRQSIAQSQFEVWLSFLKTGRLPFTAAENKDHLEAVLETVATRTAALEKLKTLLSEDSLALERLVKQHDALFLTQLAAAMSAKSQAQLPKLHQALFELFTSNGWRQLVKQELSLLRYRVLNNAFWTRIFKQLRTDNIQFIDNQTINPIFLNVLLPKIIQAVFNKNFIADILPALVLVSTDKKQTTSPLLGKKTKEEMTTEQLLLNPILEKSISTLSETHLIKTLLTQILENNKSSLITALKSRQSETISRKNKGKEGKDIDNTISDVKNKPPLTPSEASTAFETPYSKDTTVDKKTVESKPLGNDAGLDTFQKEKILKKYEKLDEILENDLKDGLFVTQAGLVLLHPFIKPFFESLDLLMTHPDISGKGGNFKDEEARIKGVHLLQYLATGEQQAPEHDLILPKILCEIPLDTPLDRYIELTDNEKKEAEELLQTVINYWKALGSVSSESLREGFLKRMGKITRRDTDWLLQVEAQTLDILIDRLPWGMGIIKLPWMTNMLFVEWH